MMFIIPLQPPKKGAKAKSPKLSKAEKERLKKEEAEQKAREEGKIDVIQIMNVYECNDNNIFMSELVSLFEDKIHFSAPPCNILHTYCKYRAIFMTS
jgi:hypothetical protein